MTQATTSREIERELHIAASPDIVWRFFTEPEKMVQWMSHEARLDPRPGGEFWLDYGGFDRASGTFIEVVPHSRLVFTWGWESLGAQVRPGASTVEVTLTPDGGGTLLRLVHSGLGGPESDSHAQGWDMFLGFLGQAIIGKSAQPPAEALSASERYASELNARLVSLRYLLESIDPGAWGKQCPGTGWPVGVAAAHAVSHLGLIAFAAATAAGRRAPQADFTTEMLAEYGLKGLEEFALVTATEVLSRLLSDGPDAVAALKAIEPETLGNAQPMAFAGGASVPAAGILEGPLLADLSWHIEDIRKGAGAA